MSKIEESVTNNCHFYGKGNENQYKHRVNIMSKLNEAGSREFGHVHTECHYSKGEHI